MRPGLATKGSVEESQRNQFNWMRWRQLESNQLNEALSPDQGVDCKINSDISFFVVIYSHCRGRPLAPRGEM